MAEYDTSTTEVYTFAWTNSCIRCNMQDHKAKIEVGTTALEEARRWPHATPAPHTSSDISALDNTLTLLLVAAQISTNFLSAYSLILALLIVLAERTCCGLSLAPMLDYVTSTRKCQWRFCCQLILRQESQSCQAVGALSRTTGQDMSVLVFPVHPRAEGGWMDHVVEGKKPPRGTIKLRRN